jgi:hypothetical protein
MHNALYDMGKPAPPGSVRAEAGKGAGVVVTVARHQDPRIKGIRVYRAPAVAEPRDLQTGKLVCRSRGLRCRDRSAKRGMTYTYAGVVADAWGQSVAVAAPPVTVPARKPRGHAR